MSGILVISDPTDPPPLHSRHTLQRYYRALHLLSASTNTACTSFFPAFGRTEPYRHVSQEVRERAVCRSLGLCVFVVD